MEQKFEIEVNTTQLMMLASMASDRIAYGEWDENHQYLMKDEGNLLDTLVEEMVSRGILETYWERGPIGFTKTAEYTEGNQDIYSQGWHDIRNEASVDTRLTSLKVYTWSKESLVNYILRLLAKKQGNIHHSNEFNDIAHDLLNVLGYDWKNNKWWAWGEDIKSGIIEISSINMEFLDWDHEMKEPIYNETDIKKFVEKYLS